MVKKVSKIPKGKIKPFLESQKEKLEVKKTNRIKPILKDLIGTEDPDDLMLEILDALKETTSSPEAGNFYTFVYKPKTPNIRYDANPLVAVMNVYSWGFSGINFHWGENRQYTFQEVVGPLHIVDKNEIDDLRRITFMRIRINN